METTSTQRSSRGRRRRTVALFAMTALVVAGAIGFGVRYFDTHFVDVERYSASGGVVTVERADVRGLGAVLVTNKGFALYVFMPDEARGVTCTGHCAFAWPPLALHRGRMVAAGPGLRTDRLGRVWSPDRGPVVTYHGWPLYTYLGDTAPGQAKGQGLDDDGGYWYVMRPSGQVIRSGKASRALRSDTNE